jgi:hypothetical protein
MPSEPLTSEQKQNAIETIRTHATDMRCPTCGEQRWALQERLHVMPAIDPSGAVDPSMGLPAIILTCKECYRVQVFNALQMGIAEQP